jgi:hypothetical protein
MEFTNPFIIVELTESPEAYCILLVPIPLLFFDRKTVRTTAFVEARPKGHQG